MEKGDLVLVAAVAVAHAWQQGMAATEVAILRRKHEIKPPVTDGPPDFIRALRAQQNCLEFGLPFQIILWTSGIFGHQVPSAVLGCYYLISRHKYIKGYIKSPDDRLQPFYHSIRALKGLIAISALGIGNVLLKQYAGVDVWSLIKQQVFPN
ncbi:MAPEG [Mactra antiquata]